MFVQVFQGPVSDAAKARAQMEKWVSEQSRDAVGWLGSTAGVTDDGMLVALARFESEELAQRNSNRPGQGAWWAEMAALFTAEPEFRNSTSVEVTEVGDLDSAGFVQVMQGRSSDPGRARELMAQEPEEFRELRPDVLGDVSVEHPDGEWTMAIYFTSEAEAREGEQKEPPPEMKAIMEEMDRLTVDGPRYHDLRDPWLHSPST
jgi:hypothetical protein